MFNLTVSEAHTYYVGNDGWLVHNTNGPNNPEFSRALRDAMQWLEERGFKAEKDNLNRFPKEERGTKVIGKTTADGRIGYRIEFDARNGAHINVFAGKEVGPHFNFKGDESTVGRITQTMFGCP